MSDDNNNNDMTESSKNAAELSEHRKRWYDMMENMPVGMFQSTPAGKFIYVNSCISTMLGYESPQELMETVNKTSIAEALYEDPSKRPVFVEEVETDIGMWRIFENRYRRKDGSIIDAILTFHVRMDPLSGEKSLYGFVQDVTERKKSESGMRRLMAAINAMEESVVITDVKGLIEYVNPCFSHVTGYTAEELIGKPVGFIKSGRQDRAFYERMWNVLLEGRTWTGCFINKRKDGSLYEECATVSPVCGNDGKIQHYVAVERDMTNIRDLEQKVVRSQKMAALGQFAHRVAHDVTNGLSTILGSAELIGRIVENDDARELAAGIIESVKKMGTLTTDIMAFANPGRARMQKCRLDAIIKSMNNMIANACGPAVTAVYDLEKGCQIMADQEQIEQVVMHLVINAVEAIDGTGSVRISVRKGVMRLHDGCSFELEVLEVPAIVMEVTDSGCGMNEEQCARIFEPFYTTKRNIRRNAGLGMSTVYGIISRHDGDITVTSEHGHGTVVKVYFPLLESPQE